MKRFVSIIALILISFVSYNIYKTTKNLNIKDILQDKELKEALRNLKEEETIATVKVHNIEEKEGRVFTTFSFIESNQENNKVYSNQKITLEGKEFYFGLFTVNFNYSSVEKGKKESLYFWRKAFSDKVSPENGVQLDPKGTAPLRYGEVTNHLEYKESELFWKSLWALNTNPESLAEHNIRASQGIAPSIVPKEGWLYHINISNTGKVEVLTELDH